MLPMEAIGRALARVARSHPDLLVVFPVHRNPIVRAAVLPALAGLPNVHITEPLPYAGFGRLLARATLILTDSGGIQEEAPEPRQAGAGHARHHRAAGGGRGRHGAPGRHRQRRTWCRR